MEKITIGIPTAADREAMARLFLDEAVSETYMVPDFGDAAEALALSDKVIKISEKEGRYVRGVYLDGEFIGLINDVGTDGGSVELGWAIHSEHHGRGYCTAAAALAAAELFSLGFEEIKAGAFEENAASLRVMEKLGMKKTGEREEVSYRGKTHVCVTYSMHRGCKAEAEK